MSVSILKPGLLSSLQDAGRPGHAALGVGRAGAMDGPAWQLANALVGNRRGEAAIECTLIGPSLRFERAAVIALTGAAIAAHVGDRPIPLWTCCRLPAGSVLRLGGMTHGSRAYLAVRGGFDVAPLLGSRSSDLHARLGYQHGRALRAGDVLPIGTTEPLPGLAAGEAVQPLHWGIDPRPWFDFGGRPLALLPGSHGHLLDPASQPLLHGATFIVSQDSNRTASRLDGHALRLCEPLELISEATLPGTLQLPPSGQPIALLAEAPVTGGYPRIGQIAAVDLPHLAQRRPGDAVCFRGSTLDEALARLAARQRRLGRLIEAIARRLEHA
ncbi:MAG: biotin-dependent carboxyltransferase family protein [Xanthomonadaceae bacterium]|nr:biotin-dependent carboxyltransferase family protein [Xanthomonadaceae bacterium]MDE3073421.1 biotin-dependent carboxyltransferase family protein [Pseudomonadota bacterium]